MSFPRQKVRFKQIIFVSLFFSNFPFMFYPHLDVCFFRYFFFFQIFFIPKR